MVFPEDDNISLISINFDDIFVNQGIIEPPKTKKIFAIENIRADTYYNENIKEAIKLKKLNKIMSKYGYSESTTISDPAWINSPSYISRVPRNEARKDIKHKLTKKRKTSELKMTQKLPVITEPIFKFVIDS